ncbi:hypothetical protein PF005_g33552 [Phytophthora fragariae]|uniref:Uncharacterized protein n=1 Tax=Phytophthora fragariae TaxID=53985 RepID=A0A6A3PBB8_9STRA|nr:hypothetical protein PF009_g33329 [Phytophthora fragariae]KAE8951415.1 hypothetical protein PF011_g32980 [Phytophthora fragariae]KAE9053417.1 hypothetical protein PF007_g32952 [Phytophthora fragariae]KAE9054897.1 hypothetical protein PF010_g32343 [Phytophthora fragariae]KAE9057690.1 hypothetical protein PF006_g32354 [Phytophthora fragariae]
MLAWTTALALNGSCQAPLRSCQSARACSRSSASVPLLPRKGPQRSEASLRRVVDAR